MYIKFLIFVALNFCFSWLLGDTFTDGSVRYTMTSMNVPEPVMSLAVQPVSKDSGGQVSSFF